MVCLGLRKEDAFDTDRGRDYRLAKSTIMDELYKSK